jgi:hypothetical protein
MRTNERVSRLDDETMLMSADWDSALQAVFGSVHAQETRLSTGIFFF